MIEGRDYLFYRYAKHAGAVVALIATRRHLFIIPHATKLDVQLDRKLDNPDVPALLSLVLADVDQTMAKLEAFLRAHLGPEHVIALDETTVKRRFRNYRIEHKSRRTVLALGSRRNHARFAQYFAA